MKTLRIATAALLSAALIAPAFAFNNGSSAGIVAHARHTTPLRATAFKKFIPAKCRWIKENATINFGPCFPAGRMVIRYAPISQVAAICDRLAPEFGYQSGFAKNTMGCSFGGMGHDGDDLTINVGTAKEPRQARVGVIIIGSDRDVKDTFFHEVAHLGGLNANHDNY